MAHFFSRVADKERSGRGEADYEGCGWRSRPTGRGAEEPKSGSAAVADVVIEIEHLD